MDCGKIKQKLQYYIDGELEKNKEPELFNHLAECEDCRFFFRSLNDISSNIRKEEFPLELEERIMFSLKDKNGKTRKVFSKENLFPVISYAFAAVFIMVSLFLFRSVNDYKREVDIINQAVKEQNQTIELLYNSLPAAEVTTKYNNVILIKAKM